MASEPNNAFGFIPKEAASPTPDFGFVPKESQTPEAPDFGFVPSEVVQQEAQRNTLGAVQALDVMAAPQAFDWTDVAEQTDRERFQAAEQAGARALQAEERGSGTGPGSEAFQWRREREFQLGQISPNTTTGRMLAQQGQRQLQEIEDVGTTAERERTPSQLLSGFMGPGLSATAQPVVESAARNLGPAAGGALGASMFLVPGGGIARMLLPLAGGFGGAQVGGAVQEEVLKTTETPEETEARRRGAAEDFARNPWATRIGAAVSQSPFFGPSLAQFGRALYGDRGAIANLGIAGLIGGGMEVAGALYQGRPVEAEDLAAGIFSNMIMNEPTKLGRRLGFHPSDGEAAVEAAQKYAELPPEGPTPIGADLQSGLTTRGTSSTADVFSRVQRQTGEPNAQQISETSTPDGGVRAPEVTPEDVPLPTPEGGEGVQPSGQGEPLVEGTPEAPREVTSPIIEEAGRALPPVSAGEGVTGIRNVVVDEQRRIAGLPAREQPLARSFPLIHEEARVALDRDPEMGQRLVSELSNEIRPLTDTEDAVLTFEQNTREQARTEAVDAVNAATTPEELTSAQQRLAEADNKLFEIYQVGQNAGTANARGLNARRLMQNRDFTLSKMLNEKMAIANDGEPLNAAQTEEVTKAHARIAELESKLAEVESGQATKNAQLEYRRLLRETSSEAKVAGKQKEQQSDFLTRIRESAKKRIKERRGKLQVTIDPLNIAGLVDETIVGATYVAEGIRDFAKWSARMVEEFGERIKPQLQALFQRSSELSDDMVKSYASGAPETPQAVAARIQPGSKLEQKTVYDLYRAHVNAGVEDFTAATKAVTEDLQKAFPSITERQVHDALSGYGKTTTPSKEADLVKLREFKNLARLTSQLEDAQKGLAPMKTGPQRDKATARVRELQKQVNTAIKKAGLKESSPGRIATAHDARVTRLKNAIEETERAIDARKRPDRPEGVAWTPEELALKQQLAEARERLDSILGEPESDRLNNVLRAIERAEEKIRTGNIEVKAGRMGPETMEMTEATNRLREANRTLSQMRNASEDFRLSRDKRAIQKRISELQQKIARGDYEVPEKREPAMDREKIDLQYQLAKEKEKWQQGVIEVKRARRSLGTKIWDTVKESANLSRAIVTSMDLPPVFRQGLFAIGRPVMAAKAVKDALISLASEKKAFAVQQEIENRPNAPLYQRAKLYLAKDTAQPLNRQEEAYMGNWFRQLPRWTVIGPALRASERTYNTFLNRIRADTFDAAVKAYDVADTDTATLQRLGDIINTMTGRSTLPGNLEKAAVGLNTFLFAPRFMMSRFKVALGEPLWTGNAKTRKFALEQYGRTLAGAALIYGLAKSAGFEIENDPRSSNFAKIKIGNTYLDPLGGLAQVTTFLTRVITGETKTGKGQLVPLREDLRPLKSMDQLLGTSTAARGKPSKFAGTTADVIGRFLRTKLNPVTGQVINLATGKDIVGKPVTAGTVAKNLAVPISFQDILETMEKQGVPKGSALYVLSLFGMGLQNRD